MTDVGLEVGALGRLVQIKEGVALLVGGIDQRTGDTVVGEGEETDVAERVPDLLDEALTLVLRGGRGQSKVNGGCSVPWCLIPGRR